MSFAAQLAVLSVVTLAVLSTYLDYQAHRGLLWGWQTTFGQMLLWLHDHAQIRIHISHIGSHTFNFGGVFGRVNNKVVGWLQDRLEAAEHDYALSVHALEATWHATVISIEWLAHETAATFDWVIHAKFPAWAKVIAAGVLPIGLLTKLIADAVRKATAHTHKEVKAAAQAVPQTIVKYIPYAAAVALPSPWAFPKFRRKWSELELWRKLTAARLKRLEALLAASGLALAVANMTGTTFRCWRGQGNIARSLRHVCGFPKWLIDLAILGAVEAFIATDLCAFSDLLIKQAASLRPALMELVDVEDALIGCHGTSKPLVFKLPAATLPPLQGVSPLAA